MRAGMVALPLLLAGIIMGCVPVASAQQQTQCEPPQEMRAKLAGRPSADTLNELGVWFADREQFPCAGQAVATSLQTDPKQPGFRKVIFMFGASLFYSGDMKEAAEALEEAERVGYRDALVYGMLARALDAEHETETAVAQWKLALEFDPESEATLDALSDDMMALRQYDAVVELLATRRLRALRTEQQVENLAGAYVETGDAAKALKVLEDGFNTYPESRGIAERLAAVLTGLHRDAEAAMVRDLAEAREKSSREGER